MYAQAAEGTGKTIWPNESANINATHAMRCYFALRNFVSGVDVFDGLDVVDVADNVGEVVSAGVSSPHMALTSFVAFASFDFFNFFETTSSQSIVDVAIDSSAFCWYMIMASVYATQMSCKKTPCVVPHMSSDGNKCLMILVYRLFANQAKTTKRMRPVVDVMSSSVRGLSQHKTTPAASC